MQGVHLVDHPLVQHKLTLMRDISCSTRSFRELMNEIGILLCYEVTRDLPLETKAITTPMTDMQAPILAGKKLVLAPILRAGVGFLDGMLQLVPSARVAHIGLYRDPVTLGDRRRSDAGHRQFGHRGDRSPEGSRRGGNSFRVPACGARGHFEIAGPPSGRENLDRGDRRETQ
jgi:uracil phosphoribosyltransferase